MNILGAIVTILILGFKQLPETNDEADGWRGMSFLCAIIATIIWISTAVMSINLGFTQSYAVFNNSSSSITAGSYTVVFPNTWPLALVYALISILPFVLIFYLWPDSWRKKGD